MKLTLSIIIIALSIFYIDTSTRERRKLQREITRLNATQHCRSIVKERVTGLVSVMDSTGRMVCQFYDGTGIVYK